MYHEFKIKSPWIIALEVTVIGPYKRKFNILPSLHLDPYIVMKMWMLLYRLSAFRIRLWREREGFGCGYKREC